MDALDPELRRVLEADGLIPPANGFGSRPLIKVDILKAALTGAAGITIETTDSKDKGLQNAAASILDSLAPSFTNAVVKGCDFIEQFTPPSTKCEEARRTIASREKK